MNNKNNVGVIVDAGHGGSDPGALGNGLLEKDLNLRAAQYMYKRLQELGIPAVIIRDTDETLPKAPRIERALKAFNNSPNTILISNHINSGGGEFTYHYIIWLGIKTAVFKQKKILKNIILIKM